MAWSETLGQVMQTRPILAYGASYLGGVIATASPCILASIPLVIGFVGGYAGGNKKQAFLYSLTFVVGLAVVMSILGAMAALMGTLPIALGMGAGAESRRPLGLAVVGGLLFSQIITLYVTPVFYTYFDGLQRLFRQGPRSSAGSTPS